MADVTGRSGRALAEVRPDFVVDVTIPEAHHDVTLAALAAGVPVLGEKPMADSMEHARAMVAASERAGKLYMVSQSRRYDPRPACAAPADRRACRRSSASSIPISTSARISAASATRCPARCCWIWRSTRFDAARYLSGADPVAVYCEEFNPPWSWYAGDACATAIFEMSGGLRYTYRGSWCAEGRHTSWEAEWRAVGPHGTATWDGHGAPVAEVVVGHGRLPFADRAARRPRSANDAPRGIAGSLRDFLHALETGATPMGECHDNIKSLAMVFARSIGALANVATE